MSIKRHLLIGGGTIVVLCGVAIAIAAFLLIHRVEGEYFDADGVRIHYNVEGTGEPVILVHGVAANADLNWRDPGVIRSLSKDFKVITFDLRGHGLSDKPSDPEQYGIRMVEDIVRLMDHLHIEKAHVAGYSLGGFLLLKLLTLHPDRVASAAICAAGWKDANDPSPLPSPFAPPPPPGRSAAVAPSTKVPADDDSAAPSAVPMAPAPKSLFRRVHSWVGDHLLDKTAKKAMKKKYLDFAVTKTELGAIHVPMACLIGTKDGFLQLARDLRSNVPGIEFCQIVGAGHLTTPFRDVFKVDLHDFFMRHRSAMGK